jgi:hypothetical protein
VPKSVTSDGDKAKGPALPLLVFAVTVGANERVIRLDGGLSHFPLRLAARLETSSCIQRSVVVRDRTPSHPAGGVERTGNHETWAREHPGMVVLDDEEDEEPVVREPDKE